MNLAKTTVKLSALYMQEDIHQIVNLKGFNNFQSHRVEFTGLDFFSVDKDNTLFIVFSGTDENIEWFIDFFAPKAVCPYADTNPEIKVHLGYIFNYYTIKDYVRVLVKSSGFKKVVVTGHSLGGAMATLCALDLQYNFQQQEKFLTIVKAYTFGSPAIGNEGFVQSYNRRVINTFRYVNGDDVITKLPYSFMKHFYHVSKEIHIGRPHRWWRYFWGGMGKFHDVNKYVEEINKKSREI